MFFSVARLRRSIALALLVPSFAEARTKELFTSSVSYCEPPQEILIDQLDLSYFPSNNSITFNISAASVLPNVSVSANILVNVYGMHSINTTFQLCDLFGGVLCPLPVYNFVGQDSITLPSSFKLNTLPGIAYVVPDLEAFAQVSLMQVDTGEVLACVQATLSNGWSMRRYEVEWSTAAIALLALSSAVWQSLTAGALALAPIRLLDILYLYQTIAASGLLGLNYPSVYTSFTLNFSWALGLFATTTSSPIQNSINHMRNLTGGELSGASSGGTVPLVNRKLSPYNTGTGSGSGSSGFSLRRSPADAIVLARDVVTVTSESSDVLEAGVPIYTNYIGILTANAFMTVFLVFLMLAAIVLSLIGVGYAIWFYMNHSESRSQWFAKVPGLKDGYPVFARAWGLRIALCTVFPVTIFAFYQWTLKDSWLSVLLSVLLLIYVLTIVLIPMFLVLRPYLPAFLSRWSSTTPSSTTPSPSWTPYTAPFMPSRAYYVVPVFLAMLVKSFVVGFGDSHGMAQAIIFLVVDVLVLASAIILKPYRTRHSDILMGFLAIVRFVCSGLSVAFSQSLLLAAIPRVVVGIIMAVIFSVTVVVMFLNTLVNMGAWRLFKYAVCCGRRRRGGDKKLKSNPDWDSSSEMEKGGKDASKADVFSPGVSEHSFQRPSNPTPPTVGSITPQSATAQASLYTESSETTLGEPLPRRWSFQHSQPPSHTEPGSPSSYAYARRSVTPSPSTPTSGLPSRHSRHPSSNAPHGSPIEERYSREGFA